MTVDSPRKTKALVVACLAAYAFVVAGCGGSEPRGAEQTPRVGEVGVAGWWLFDDGEGGFGLVDGGLAEPRVGETGEAWSLEYSGDRGKTLQLTAWRRDSRFVEVAEASPEVGSAKVGDSDMTLRRYPGDAAGKFAPSVNACWVDGYFLCFGGGALSEEELRADLRSLRRVSRQEWQTSVELELGRR